MKTCSFLTTMLSKFALSLSIMLLIAVHGHADSRSVDSLMRFAGNIHQFNEIFPQEKVYLQFDNTSYYVGDNIWFKAFVVNASTLGRAQSKVLYVDLISPAGVIIEQQKLKIVAGQTDGCVSLVDQSTSQARARRGIMNFPSGFYEVRAYTNYMLNFNEEAVFSRVFAVYEKPKDEGNYYGENPTINQHKTENSEIRPKPETLSSINCDFYPEGGHIIEGKPCRVAFKVTDDSGLGVNATGVLEGTGQTISTIHNGMGSFTFIPQDKRNQVRITVGDKSRTFSLPQPEQTGCALSVKPCGMDSIEVRIDCTPDLKGMEIGLTMTCRGELIGFCSFRTGDEPISKVISMASLPEGVCRINIFDKKGNIYASRSVYHRSMLLKAPVLEYTADKPKYEPFEKVELNFTLKDGAGVPFRDRFCLSVRDIRGQRNVLADDLRTSMLLSSDLKGFIENPAWYFDSDAPERDQALDLLMLVQGWERYDWITMTGQNNYREKHRLEESLTMNGWIMNSSGKKPLDGVNVLAALMPKDKSLSETYSYITDTTGYFGFDIGVDFYDKAKLTINAQPYRKNGKKKKSIIGPDARIVFDRAAKPGIRAYTPQELVFKSRYTTDPSNRVKDKTEDDGLPTVINTNTGLLLPDVVIEEDRIYTDYFVFSSFDIAKDVEVELDKGEYSTDLMGYLIEKGYSVEETIDNVNINGLPAFFYIHNNSKIRNQGIFSQPLSIDTKDTKSIIVFEEQMYLKDILKQCPLLRDYLRHTGNYPVMTEELYARFLLLDVLVKEDHEIPLRDEIYRINRRVTSVDGYSRQYEYYSPEYPNGPVAGDIDYRRTLYWNPNVITDSIGQAKVEFYNNSITSHFNISAAGITAGGVPYILDTGF